MKILDYESFINEDSDKLSFENSRDFINSLLSAKNEISQLKLFLEYYPKGIEGEDFYNTDHWHPNFNKVGAIVNNLIEKGFMKFEDESKHRINFAYFSGTILITDLGMLAAKWDGSLEEFYSRYKGTISGKKYNI